MQFYSHQRSDDTVKKRWSLLPPIKVVRNPDNWFVHSNRTIENDDRKKLYRQYTFRKGQQNLQNLQSYIEP